MVNYNGTLTDHTDVDIYNNRAFLYGDALFETVKVLDGKVLFLEDHYFRLMASMRIVRMEIPMNFTMEFFEEEILKAIPLAGNTASSYRVRFTVFRKGEGKYLPENKNVAYVVSAEALSDIIYTVKEKAYEVDLFKDFYVTKDLLSTLKTTGKMLNITASIYAEENDYENCLLLNNEKNVVEAINGNLFLVFGNQVKTPPIADGCLKGVMRKQIIDLVKKIEGYELVEGSVSPFELQKADEMFLTNVIIGVQPVSKYKKKVYAQSFSSRLVQMLNTKIRLDSF